MYRSGIVSACKIRTPRCQLQQRAAGSNPQRCNVVGPDSRVPNGVPSIGKVLAYQRHRDGTFTHRRGYTSGRPAPHVPAAKIPG